MSNTYLTSDWHIGHDGIIGPIKYKGFWITHHCSDGRYINMCPEHTNNLPLSFQEIKVRVVK